MAFAFRCAKGPTRRSGSGGVSCLRPMCLVEARILLSSQPSSCVFLPMRNAVRTCVTSLMFGMLIFNPHYNILEDQVVMSRVQRRLLHTISQEAEKYLGARLLSSLPTPEHGEAYHPSKKSSGCNFELMCFPGYLFFVVNVCSLNLRDGRTIRKERKPKHVLALQRFLAKSTGFVGRAMDSSLESLGLADLCPSHHHRLLVCKASRRLLVAK